MLEILAFDLLELNATAMNIEPLEIRIAPATLVNPQTVTYTDVDGDDVTVKTTKGTFVLGANILFIDADPGPDVREQLQLIDMQNSMTFAGASITITAKRSLANGGDGLVNVGFIDASGTDLGAVTVDGDLGRIEAGDTNGATAGLRSLTVQSLGAFGILTQANNGTTFSSVVGAIGTLTVKSDVFAASVTVDGGASSADGKIGKLTIGGSLVGGGALTGFIFAEGDIGPMKVGGDILGGGDGLFGGTGSIGSGGKIASVTVGGSLIGSPFNGSGQISSVGDMGPVKVGGSLRGGGGIGSGKILSGATLGTVTIGGSVLGGAGDGSGSIVGHAGKNGAMKIGGHIIGGGGIFSGAVRGDGGEIASVTVGGSVLGGAGMGSGSIFGTVSIGKVTVGGSLVAGTAPTALNSGAIRVDGGGLGFVTIGGDVIGGTIDSGRIAATGALAGVKVAGSLVGGIGGGNSGVISSGGTMGFVTIGHDIVGHASTTGNIFSGGALAGVKIGGSLMGGLGDSGKIESDDAIGAVTIGRDIIGGDGSNRQGFIGGSNAKSLAKLTVGGSMLGGAGTLSAAVQVAGPIGPVKIGGDVRGTSGGGGQNSGSIAALGSSIASLTIGGSLIGGAGSGSAGSISAGALGAVKIGGDVRGGTTFFSGQLSAQTIASVTLGGSLVGGTADFTGNVSGLTSLGPVKIAGDIRGGSVSGAASAISTGDIFGGAIGSVSVGGSIYAGKDESSGTLTRSGAIRSESTLGAVTVKGSLVGNDTNPVFITGRGLTMPAANATSNVAIKSVAIGGSVSFARILAGYNGTGTGENGSGAGNPDAQIGAVTVGRDWIASSLAAGVVDGGNGFGNDLDTKAPGQDSSLIVSKIASVTIKGQALGTAAVNGDHFGFVAQQIGSLSVAGTKFPLTAGAQNDDLDGNDPLLRVGATNDLRVHEVAL
jgi:hypothetical protein